GRPRRSGVLATAERRGGRRPRLAVAGQAVGAELGAERDQRRKVPHRLDRPRLRDPDEAVRVEVVAEQQRGVLVDRGEQARHAVVEQVALVDRLEPDRVALLAEPREHGLALRLRLQRLGPQLALVGGLLGDRLPEVEGYSHPASSFVQYETIRSAPARLIAVSDSSAACRSSSQPRAPAAFSIAYSPETLYAPTGRSKRSRAARITSRFGSAGLTRSASAPSATSSSHSRSASRTLAGSSW